MEELLLKNGWIKHEVNPFKEKVAEKANAFYTFSNSRNTEIGFLFFNEGPRILIRLHSPVGNELRYFDLKSNDISKTVEKIVALQNTTDVKDYFSFYMDMQAVSDISIMAWEQWESNYR